MAGDIACSQSRAAVRRGRSEILFFLKKFSEVLN